MQQHFITELLGIKDNHVELWSVDYANEFTIELRTKVKRQTCKHCKNRTKRVHGYRWQAIKTLAPSHILVRIDLKKRRYLCVSCGHTFYERLQFVDRYQRYTSLTQTTALMYAGTQSFKQAANHAGLTPNQVIRLMDHQTINTRKVLPRAISIDEFKGDADGERFQTVIVDVYNHTIIDILPDRKIETIKSYLRTCDTSQVEIVVMDLSKAFKKAMCDVLDNPLIIADRFHYMRHVYWALDDIRRQVQHDVDDDTRKKMKRSKKLLWKSPDKLSEDEKEKLELLLQIDSRLREAYDLKNEVNQWFKTSDQMTAKQGLEKCIQFLKETGLEPFHSVGRMFQRWAKEIVHSFMYPYSNGITEGINNSIKVLKRISYGIRSFERLRRKVLWHQLVLQSFNKASITE